MKEYKVNKYGVEIEGVAIKPNSRIFIDEEYVYDKNKKVIVKLKEKSLGLLLWSRVLVCLENIPNAPLFKVGDLAEYMDGHGSKRACVISKAYLLNNKNCYDVEVLKLLNNKLSRQSTNGVTEDRIRAVESSEYKLIGRDENYIVRIRRN